MFNSVANNVELLQNEKECKTHKLISQTEPNMEQIKKIKSSSSSSASRHHYRHHHSHHHHVY